MASSKNDCEMDEMAAQSSASSNGDSSSNANSPSQGHLEQTHNFMVEPCKIGSVRAETGDEDDDEKMRAEVEVTSPPCPAAASLPYPSASFSVNVELFGSLGPPVHCPQLDAVVPKVLGEQIVCLQGIFDTSTSKMRLNDSHLDELYRGIHQYYFNSSIPLGSTQWRVQRNANENETKAKLVLYSYGLVL